MNIFDLFYQISVVFLSQIKLLLDKYLYTNNFLAQKFKNLDQNLLGPVLIIIGVKDNLSLPKLLNDEPLISNVSIKYI